MARKHFGTDGIRGVANRDLTPEFCLRVGRAAGLYLLEQGLTPRVVIGADTRRSGPMIGACVAAGICETGVDVVTMTVVPTGCISYVARTGEYGMGVMISASHNPAPDNGIKLIAHDGCKLSDAAEERIEELLTTDLADRPVGDKLGALTASRTDLEGYIEYLESLVPEGLDGMKVVLDGSHGAGYRVAASVLRRLGADLTVIGVEPDGLNINLHCGATHPQTMQDLTVKMGADVGIALDGDADRAVFSDSQGRLINGDRTMAIWANHWISELEPKAVVGTVMSNGGFETSLESHGIELIRADVGDRHVAAQLRRIGGLVGGEQSGHIIFTQRGPTGDGLITFLELLRVLKREGRPASSFVDDYEPWPQLLVNVTIASKEAFKECPEVQTAIAEASAMLGERGRINVRPSGTQPMVRVMVEADAYDLRDQATEHVVQAFQEHLSGTIYSRVDLTHALGD